MATCVVDGAVVAVVVVEVAVAVWVTVEVEFTGVASRLHALLRIAGANVARSDGVLIVELVLAWPPWRALSAPPCCTVVATRT